MNRLLGRVGTIVVRSAFTVPRSNNALTQITTTTTTAPRLGRSTSRSARLPRVGTISLARPSARHPRFHSHCTGVYGRGLDSVGRGRDGSDRNRSLFVYRRQAQLYAQATALEAAVDT